MNLTGKGQMRLYRPNAHREGNSEYSQRLSKDHRWRIAEISWGLGSERLKCFIWAQNEASAMTMQFSDLNPENECAELKRISTDLGIW